MQNKNNRGGINFDAKIRRNSTYPADLFYARIGGMDTFARALIVGDKILQNGEYAKFRKERYASFDAGKGKQFEQGKLTLEELQTLAHKAGEPEMISGKQEYYENLISRFV